MDRLPAELVGLIIDLAAAHALTPAGYQTRQTTLRRISLVSRRFNDVARPRLWQVVVVETEEQVEALEQQLKHGGSSDLAGLPEKLVAAYKQAHELEERHQGFADAVLAVVVDLPALQDVYMDNVGMYTPEDVYLGTPVQIDLLATSSGPFLSASTLAPPPRAAFPPS